MRFKNLTGIWCWWEVLDNWRAQHSVGPDFSLLNFFYFISFSNQYLFWYLSDLQVQTKVDEWLKEIFGAYLLNLDCLRDQLTVMMTHFSWCHRKLLGEKKNHVPKSSVIHIGRLTVSASDKEGYAGILIETGSWIALGFLFPLLYLPVAISLGWVLPVIFEISRRKWIADCRLLLRQDHFSLATKQLFPESLNHSVQCLSDSTAFEI